MKALFERVRWHVAIEQGDDVFKVNNNLTSHYARLIMTCEPDLAEFFETRELRAQ